MLTNIPSRIPRLPLDDGKKGRETEEIQVIMYPLNKKEARARKENKNRKSNRKPASKWNIMLKLTLKSGRDASARTRTPKNLLVCK